MKTTTVPAWLRITRNTTVCLLVFIALVVATRRGLTITGLIKAYVNPKYGAFDSGLARNKTLTFLHIITGSLFLILTPFQFVKTIRSGNIKVHRFYGWVIIICAYIIGITAIVMGFKIPIGGIIETIATLTFAVYFVFAVSKALFYIIRKEIELHRIWMIRMFAVGLAIATVRPIVGTFFAFSNMSPHQFFGIAFWIGFILHTIIAEIYIRKFPSV